ncbi:MAG: GntR family transcriptional regulator [Burkholderiaceae bacterium]
MSKSIKPKSHAVGLGRARAPREQSSVERLYFELRERAMRYEFRPGERINEQALGHELGVSRPPLREALNRLVAEGFLEFVMNKGFIRKSISVEEVFNLYQVRIALERRAVMLAIKVAGDDEIAAVRTFWLGMIEKSSDMAVGDLLLADEAFHRKLVALSHNKELVSFLDQVTRRIHIAHHVDLEQSEWTAKSLQAHTRVVDLMLQRNTEAALEALTEHIDMSLKRAVAITREMVARFFLQDQPKPDTSYRTVSETESPQLS